VQTSLPTISVVIPVFNGVKTIEKAILSIIEQDYPHVELLIFDGGSTDGTVDVIERYAAKIHYWQSKPDGGAYLSINAGSEQASGEVFAQLMADDWFEPGIFSAVSQAFVENPAADIVSCGGRFVRFEPQSQQYKTLQQYQETKVLELNFYNICFAIPAMSSRFIKKSLLDKISLFKPVDSYGKTIFSADREFLLRAIAYGAQSVTINRLGHTYLAHEDSATFGNNRKTQMKICGEHMAIAENYLVRNDLTPSQHAVLKYWYLDQSVRLLIFKLMSADFSAAWDTTKQGLYKFKMAWLVATISVPCKIIIKKISTNS
jgi:glycosyltransferase involved in cell wall biosynthesis